MLQSGWIEEAPKPSKAKGREARRKYYRLTRLGRRQLKAELERLDAVVAYARSKALLET